MVKRRAGSWKMEVIGERREKRERLRVAEVFFEALVATGAEAKASAAKAKARESDDKEG